MKYTSAQANKLLKKLTEQIYSIRELESKSSIFYAAVGEDVESVRPEYDYAKTQQSIDELENSIRTVKHAINQFNATTIVEGFDMTIDQILVYIPQLTSKKRRLAAMAQRLPKQRSDSRMMSRNTTIIDYEYTNYDIKTVAEDYERVSEELSRAQTALDLVNSTETMEIDI